MELIAHRINTVEELQYVPADVGVEIDLRDDLTGRIYLQHDPFVDGEDFDAYLVAYVAGGHRGTMILNVKSERIEHRALELLKKHGIERFFFLDSTFPMIKTLSDLGEHRIALRFSELEGLDTIRAMQGRAQWVWVDCFTRMPLTKAIADELHAMGYQICIVSPELEGQSEKIAAYRAQLAGISCEAVCTKRAHFAEWENV